MATLLNQVAENIDPEDGAAARPVSGLLKAISNKLKTLAPTVTTIMTTQP